MNGGPIEGSASLAEVEAARGKRLPVIPADPDHLRSRTAPELLEASFPATRWLIDPLLERPGLAMLYGPTGVAKTHLAMAIAVAVAAGQPLLGWTCHASPCVYVDGELGARRMQQRLAKHVSGFGVLKTDVAQLQVITRDDQPHQVMPDLADPDAQGALLDSLPKEPGLLILDNLSTLTGMLDSNDAGSWSPMQELLLRLKALGWGVIVVHHANAGGTQQAGTSRRTHVLDTILSLRPHVASEGTPPGAHDHDIEVHLVKGREIPPGMREPFLATLTNPYGATDRLTWARAGLAERQADAVLDALRSGIPAAAIAQQLGLHLATVYRRRNAAIAAGELKPPTRKTPERSHGPD